MLVTPDTYSGVMDRLDQVEVGLVADVETTGLDTVRDSIAGVGVGVFGECARGEAWYFPFGHETGPNLPVAWANPLIKLIERKGQDHYLIGHNFSKFDMQFLRRAGLHADPMLLDTMIGAFLWDDTRRLFGKNYRLEDLSAELFGEQATKMQRMMKDLLTSHLLGEGEMSRLPAHLVEPYACEDLVLSERLAQFLLGVHQNEGTVDVWRECSAYGSVLGRMQGRGMLIDVERVQELSRDSTRELLRLVGEMQKLAGYPIKPTTKHFAGWLGVDSTNKEALEAMGDDPRAALVREFRDYEKVNGTYYKKFLRTHVNGVLYPDLNQLGTRAGRLSCSNPNLQALPREGNPRYRVKECFVARPGYVLLQADYSRAEMCLASWYGQERAMADLLESGHDIHGAVAAEIGIPRPDAKRINFSIVYGIGASTLSENLKISEARAANYLRRYHRQYPGFRRLYNKADRLAKKRRFIQLWTGRRIRYPDPDSRHRDGRTPTHKASDHLIQGGVGELLRERQTQLDVELRSEHDVHQLLAVHDSAIMECPEDQAPAVVPKVREIMEERERFYPSMVVDVGVGPTMAQMEAV